MEHIILRAQISGTDADATKYLYNPLAETLYIEAIAIVPHVSVAVNGTNYNTETITNEGQSSAVIATHTTNTGGAALVAGTPLALTFSATGVGKVLEIAPGGVLKVALANTATGPAYDEEIVVTCVRRK